MFGIPRCPRLRRQPEAETAPASFYRAPVIIAYK
jgi:hypothetical protein